ncbi:MAG TPA: erythromycin esterase family protein [Kofleriaceae bacterium]|nr:erythromycin esterase family protein [Kofleriaceae bacterium]
MAYRPVGEVPEAVHAIARPLRGDGGAELDQIAQSVADRRIVMIGEASHGTQDFYAMRAALTRRLVEEHGFTAVCVEGDWPDCLRVDRFVRGLGDDDTADEALASFERFPRWMWRNEDVAEFATWLRNYNLEREGRERCGFYGIDLYSLHASMQALIHYLEENDDKAAARAKERYACFDHVGVVDPQQYGLQAHIGAGRTCEGEVVAQLVEMQMRKLARSGRSPTGDAWFHAVQQAHVVRNAEAYYRTMFAGRSTSWNLRDTHMMDTLDFIADHLGDGAPAKVIVWAHNSHVGDARATELGDDGQVTIGQLARQRHPKEVALIGFTTYTGSVIAAHDWEDPAQRMRVRAGLPGSWEELFHEAQLPRFYVTAPDLKTHIGEGVERIQRAIGVVYRPDNERRSHYLHARLADEFDVVIHLDATRGLTPLDPLVESDQAAPHFATEVPETFPTGV